VNEEQIYTLRALTDIWTGDADCKGERLINSGLLGSIRWWLEVLVRGLGGSACDPSHHDDNKSKPCPNEAIKDPLKPGHHCVVCELFGCTGWARKFRFEVLDAQGNVQQNQIKGGDTFQLAFTPLRPVCPEEWALLNATIRLIADYAAIGGRTVYKPSDESSRKGANHHRDYGIVSIEKDAGVEPVNFKLLQAYVGDQQWREVKHEGFAWASLRNFWCIKGRYLARQDANHSKFNQVLERPEPKNRSSRGDSWLAGRRAGSGGHPESKKVFRFKNPPRTFGFVQSANEADEMKQRLREKAWLDLRNDEFLKGCDILDRLLGGAGGST
jgi:CRISPR-associated protein Cmr1